MPNILDCAGRAAVLLAAPRTAACSDRQELTTTDTSAMVVDAAQRRANELSEDRGSPGSPFAGGAPLYVIAVRLRDTPDDASKRERLRVPTALTILPTQVRDLREAGRRTLRAAPQFQKLLGSLKNLPIRSEAGGKPGVRN